MPDEKNETSFGKSHVLCNLMDNGGGHSSTLSYDHTEARLTCDESLAAHEQQRAAQLACAAGEPIESKLTAS